MSAIRFLIALGLAAAVAACGDQTPAPAPGAAPASGQASQPGRSVTFEHSGMQFSFALPAGYCEPTGRYVARAAEVAGGDGANVTKVSFNDCASMAQGGNLSRWGMVKAPRSMVTMDVGTRDNMIAEMKRQFEGGNFLRSLEQAAAQSGVPASVKPLGTDYYGAYVGGTVQVEGRTIAGVWSMTVIKHRMLAVYMYGQYSSERDVTAVLDQVKEATRNFVMANPG